MQYLETMKAILPLVLLFLGTTILAQNIPSIEQVEAELEELKKKDDLRAYTLELARQRDSLIEVFDRQFFNLEQELSSTEASLSQLEFDFDNAMTSIEALNQNKEMLENKNESLEEFADSLWNNNHPVFTWKDYEWIFEEEYSKCLKKGREDFDIFFNQQNQFWNEQ